MFIIPQQVSKQSGGMSFKFPMLNSSNYTVWAIKMEAILDAQEVWEAVNPAEEEEVNSRNDKKARAYILQAIPEDVLLQITKKKTAKEIWESLKTRYLGADRVKKARLQTLKSEFDALRMAEQESIDEFAGKLSGMSSRFTSLGADLDFAALVKKLLDCVPERYFTVVAGIEQFYDLETMPFEEAIGRLKAFEERARLRENTGSGGSQLMFTHNERQAPQGNNTGEASSFAQEYESVISDRGKGEWREQSRGKSDRNSNYAKCQEGTGGNDRRSRDKSHIKCFNCGKMGHYASECRSKSRNDEKQYKDATTDEPALLFSMPQEETRDKQQDAIQPREESVMKVFHHGEEKKTSTKNVWYLDNGASNHITGRREMFQELDEKFTGEVRLGDDNAVQVEGKGTVVFQYKNGHQYILHESCTSNRLYNISLELAKPICLLASFEKSEGVAGATKSDDGAACSPPAAGEASSSTSTLRIEVPGGTSSGEFRRRRWGDRRRARTRRKGRGNDSRHNESSIILDPQDRVDLKRSMGEEADCIHARTAERDATRKEVLETFMKVRKEREALLTNLQTKMKSLEKKFARTQKQERPSHWHYVRSSLWQPLQQYAEISG
ncbi:hypothetical protein AKJ16_DCAP06673 [Drosera capensis]